MLKTYNRKSPWRLKIVNHFNNREEECEDKPYFELENQEVYHFFLDNFLDEELEKLLNIIIYSRTVNFLKYTTKNKYRSRTVYKTREYMLKKYYYSFLYYIKKYERFINFYCDFKKRHGINTELSLAEHKKRKMYSQCQNIFFRWLETNKH